MHDVLPAESAGLQDEVRAVYQSGRRQHARAASARGEPLLGAKRSRDVEPPSRSDREAAARYLRWRARGIRTGRLTLAIEQGRVCGIEQTVRRERMQRNADPPTRYESAYVTSVHVATDEDLERCLE